MPVLRNADSPASKATNSVAVRYGVAVLGAWAAETGRQKYACPFSEEWNHEKNAKFERIWCVKNSTGKKK